MMAASPTIYCIDTSSILEWLCSLPVSQMLIYVAEATDIDRALLKAAAKGALTSRATMGSMSAAIRRLIPWKLVEVALLAKS